MRSAALPPMGACVAMQLRRDGAKRSLRTGAAELSEARAILLGSFAKHATPLTQEKLCGRLSLVVAVLKSGDIDGDIARVAARPARLVFERRAATTRAVIR